MAHTVREECSAHGAAGTRQSGAGMTPWEMVGYIPAVAGAVHALGGVWRQPWAVTLRRRRQERSRWRAERRCTGTGVAPQGADRMIFACYDLPGGGRLMVWSIASVTAPPCSVDARTGAGPW